MTLVKVNGNPTKKTYTNFFDEWLNEWSNFGRDDQNVQYSNAPVNIHETKGAYHLELNTPGVKKEDIKVQAENGLLTISYEQKEETKNEDYKTIRREFRYHNFKRSFTLSDKIDADKIVGKYEDGILKLFVPKKAEAQLSTRQIDIQ